MKDMDLIFNVYKYIKENVKEDDLVKASSKAKPTKITEVVDKPVKSEESLEGKDPIVNAVAEPQVETKPKELKDKEIDKDIKQDKVPESKKPVVEQTEEIVLGEFSDEKVAKDFAIAKKGVVVVDPQSKKWKVTAAKESKEVKEVLDADSQEVANISKKYGFGSVAWQDAMIDRIKNKLMNGVPLPGIDTSFIETQMLHNKNNEIEELNRMWKANNANVPNESKEVKEDIEITVKTDDKETHIVSVDGGTQISTVDLAPDTEVISQGDVENPVSSEPIVTEPVTVEEPEVEKPAEEELPIESKKVNEDVAGYILTTVEPEGTANEGLYVTVVNGKDSWAGLLEYLGGTYESKKKTISKEEFIKLSEKKLKESSDDFTYGFAESVQKSLNSVLGVKVDITKISNKLKTMDRLGLDALKDAVQTNNKEVLNKFLGELVA